MDRQTIEREIKKIASKIKERPGHIVGSRHPTPVEEGKDEERRGRGGVGNEMDAVRDLVNKQK